MEADLERRRIRGSWDIRDGEVEMSSQWPTVDGPLGVTQLDDCVKKARNFFYGGFFLLPWLWFVNCFYFWPVLRHRSRCPEVRPYMEFSRKRVQWLNHSRIGAIWLGFQSPPFPDFAELSWSNKNKQSSERTTT